METNLSVIVKKYSVPVLFFFFGIFLLVAGIKGKQDNMFLMSSVLMFIAGFLSIIYSSGKLKTSILSIIGIAAGIGALVTMYFSWMSVAETNEYNKNYTLCKSEAIQNLTDIRYAQKIYSEVNGKYISDWDSLVYFINTGTVPFVESQGVVPSRKMTPEESKFIYRDNRPIDINMTEKEAYKLAKSPICPDDLKDFKRDTVQVSLLKSKYLTKSNTESRKNAGLKKFNAEDLPYIPFTDKKEKWKMVVKDSIQVGEDFFPAIEVSGIIPFSKIQGSKNEKVSFGKLTSNETAGSWEDE